MLNSFESSGSPAHLRYDDGDFHVLMPGAFVVCAITKRQIPLEELRYWSVARQEAYIDVDASLEAEQRANKG